MPEIILPIFTNGNSYGNRRPSSPPEALPHIISTALRSASYDVADNSSDDAEHAVAMGIRLFIHQIQADLEFTAPQQATFTNEQSDLAYQQLGRRVAHLMNLSVATLNDLITPPVPATLIDQQAIARTELRDRLRAEHDVAGEAQAAIDRQLDAA